MSLPAGEFFTVGGGSEIDVWRHFILGEVARSCGRSAPGGIAARHFIGHACRCRGSFHMIYIVTYVSGAKAGR
jgi:hypothetical protein